MNMQGGIYEIDIKLKNTFDWLNQEKLTNIKDFYQDGDFITFEWEDGELVINKDEIKSFVAKRIKEKKNGKTKINEKKDRPKSI